LRAEVLGGSERHFYEGAVKCLLRGPPEYSETWVACFSRSRAGGPASSGARKHFELRRFKELPATSYRRIAKDIGREIIRFVFGPKVVHRISKYCFLLSLLDLSCLFRNHMESLPNALALYFSQESGSLHRNQATTAPEPAAPPWRPNVIRCVLLLSIQQRLAAGQLIRR
jgi:hypothetical protein